MGSGAVDITKVRARLSSAATGFKSPVAFAARPNDSNVFVAEQNTARIIAFDPAKPAARTVTLDLHGAVAQGNEQGLLGLAFSLDGKLLFIDYTDPKGDTRIDEYRMTSERIANTASRRQLLVQQQPFTNHNGGQLVVGRDGMLYIAFGDGGLAADPYKNGQNLNTLLGKILRIDPRPEGAAPYSAPSDNPFANIKTARPEVWQWGLRNPWRFSFDRANNDLWIGDVGQNEYEEIDHIGAGVSGKNFGWNKREGTHPFANGTKPPGAIEPVLDYSHADGACSVTGGYVYRGPERALQGIYIFADFCAGKLIGIESVGSQPRHADLHARVDQPTSFGQDNNGNVYVLSRNGTIYKISA